MRGTRRRKATVDDFVAARFLQSQQDSGDSLAPLVDQSFLEQARKEVAAAGCIPTHKEVRRMTAKDASSWSEAIIAEREERFGKR